MAFFGLCHWVTLSFGFWWVGRWEIWQDIGRQEGGEIGLFIFQLLSFRAAVGSGCIPLLEAKGPFLQLQVSLDFS